MRGEKKLADSGQVEFIATWQRQDQWGQLRELSRFVRRDNTWLYRDGEVEHIAMTVHRNAACPCGSGKKYKRCCRP